MSTIFISHSSADNALAQDLARRLAQQGHTSVFLDLDVEKGIVATRQLAKRQLTWLRSDPEAHWLIEEQGDILGQALKFVEGAVK